MVEHHCTTMFLQHGGGECGRIGVDGERAQVLDDDEIRALDRRFDRVGVAGAALDRIDREVGHTHVVGPDAIVYEQFGSLHTFDPKSGRSKEVKVTVTGDFPATRPHFTRVGSRISNATVSPTVSLATTVGSGNGMPCRVGVRGGMTRAASSAAMPLPSACWMLGKAMGTRREDSQNHFSGR